jgi:hypothetical protein
MAIAHNVTGQATSAAMPIRTRIASTLDPVSSSPVP